MCERVSNVCDMVEMIWNRIGFLFTTESFERIKGTTWIHTLTLFRYVAKTLNQGSMCALMRSKLCVRIHGCKCSFCSVLSKIVKKYSDIPQTMAETSRWIFRYCPFVNEIRNKRRSVILTGFCMPFFSICFHFNAFWIALYTFSTT